MKTPSLFQACMTFMKKADDCYELKCLRKFRDEQLLRSESGKKLVMQYYELSSFLIEKIHLSSTEEKIYPNLYDTLKECCKKIDEENFDEVVIELLYTLIQLKIT